MAEPRHPQHPLLIYLGGIQMPQVLLRTGVGV